MLFTLVIFVVYGLIAAALRGQLLSRPRLLTWLQLVLLTWPQLMVLTWHRTPASWQLPQPRP